MTSVSVDKRELNAEQLKAVEHGKGPLMIIAGAGTGKTTVITERISYLISKGFAKPQEILALTFTEKAASEMEERVDKAMPYGVTQMWISTFHAFCDRILRSEGIHIGINPSYILMTETDAILFFRKHIHSFQLTYFKPLGNPTKFISGMIQHFSRLKDEEITPAQYEAWVHKKNGIEDKGQETGDKKQGTGDKGQETGDRKQGTGDKGQGTRDKEQEEMENVEEREKYIELARAYKTYEELKIKEGVADYSDLISHTLSIFTARPHILKQYQEQFKYILIDEFQDTNFAQNSLAILLSGKRKNITVVGDDDQAVYRWRGAAISNMIQFRKTYPKTTIVVLTKNYRSTKEILDRSYDLIQHNNPDRLEVAEHIDKKLESMRRVNGDPIQILYAERVEHEAELVAGEIMQQVTGDKEQEKKYSWSDVAILVRANAHAEPFARALSRAGIPFQFLGPGQLYKKPEVKDLIAYLKVLYNFEDNVAFYRILSMECFHLDPRDIAAISNAAKKYGCSLFEICENLAELSRYNFLDPLLTKDNLSIIDGSAKFEKRSSEIIPLNSARSIKPSVGSESIKQIKFIVEMIHKHLGLLKKETAGQILYYFLEKTGLLKQLAEYANTKDETVALNISKFFQKLKEYETSHEEASVFSVVDWIEMSMQLGESPMASSSDWSIDNAVRIMTVHSSKGLEFPIVFLVNLVSQRFPSMERKEQIPVPTELLKEILPSGDVHLQEERRLFYVGMTRARDGLFLTAAKYYGDGKREKKLSPFIYESIGPQASIPEVLYSQNTSAQLSFLDFKKDPSVEKLPTPKQHISYISYSQLSSFQTCPLQYKYRYVIKIPVPASAALSFGDVIHKSLQQFYTSVQKRESVSLDTLLTAYASHWVSVGYGNKTYEEKMRQHGVELLTQFFQKGYVSGVIPTAIEEPFKIKISEHVTLGGKIDRIDTHEDGSIEIIDYKTGTATKTRDVSKDPQLTIYAMSASGEGVYKKKPENVIVSFYFLEGQEKISGTRTQAQIDNAKIEISQTVDAIERSTFQPTPGRHCDFCEFRLLCEAWN